MKQYLQWDGTFLVQPIEEIESCNDFVAALKSCPPFQDVYDLKKYGHMANVRRKN